MPFKLRSDYTPQGDQPRAIAELTAGIKRGYKHGIRLVGTLKSEPDMNVLAIYER